MLRSTRGVALLTLALINVFTLAAGLTLARMLPPRLAMLKPVQVASRPEAGSSPAMASAVGGAMPTGSGLDRALSGVLSSASLGTGVSAEVADQSGHVLWSRSPGQLTAPASTEKVATAVAALAVLGPGQRFSTKVVSGQGDSIVLVGGGDPTLTAGAAPISDYPQPASLQELAATTARALKAAHRTQVELDYDTSLYTGPGLAPGWPESYVTTGDVTDITALEVDQGRVTTSDTPEDADDPTNFRARAIEPALEAATSFAGFLARDGITVSGEPSTGAAAHGATVLGSVSSPAVSAMVEQMLLESNNVIAENLARHVALATGHPASFAGGATAETAALARLGVGSGLQLVDGSGLSPQDQIAPAALVRLLVLASSPQHASLRTAITGLPVAGFAGTLSEGQSVFGGISGPARGVVRAKTGNLSTVAALAGLVYDRNGRVLVFAFNAASVPGAGELDSAADTLNDAASALASCGCH
ncbi:MAG TPA: D-alanyl-D-alanine carboxypeptidase/D-alanyl-D-alanine-endopeptidase [Streptosporangiaceae bacterium]